MTSSALDEALENHAFMARLFKVGGRGVEAVDWVSYLVGRLGGFIGDIGDSPGDPLNRLAVALSPSALGKGVDLPPSIVRGLREEVLAELPEERARVLLSLIGYLRGLWKEGRVEECSISGENVSFDFVRGRHLFNVGRRIGAIHVHGMTVSGDRKLVSVGQDGICRYADGSKRLFVDVARPENAEHPGDTRSIRLPAPGHIRDARLATRVANTMAGGAGPDAKGMLFSVGEDGEPMIVAAFADAKSPIVRFTPSGIRIIDGDRVLARSECASVASLTARLRGREIALARLGPKGVSIVRSPTEIRTSA